MLLKTDKNSLGFMFLNYLRMTSFVEGPSMLNGSQAVGRKSPKFFSRLQFLVTRSYQLWQAFFNKNVRLIVMRVLVTIVL